jgi:hypothetical protein
MTKGVELSEKDSAYQNNYQIQETSQRLGESLVAGIQ